MSLPPPPHLDYALQKPWHRRRLVRPFIFFGLVGVIGMVAYQSIPPIWRHAQML